MEFGDREEGEVLAALLGGFTGFFLRPWGLDSLLGTVAGMCLAGGLTMLIDRLADENFSPDVAATLGVFVSVMVMHAVGI